MKRNNGGFSLVEIVVAIAILGIFATATCSSLVLALRMNGKTETMLQAQLAVSSAVETLMAEGITEAKTDYDNIIVDENPVDRFPDVTVETTQTDTTLPYYTVTVTSNDGAVSVTTHIRKAVTDA